MQTKIKKITLESLQQAKQIIVEGGVVAMPTETVYGLGADACNDQAVQSIFAIKGRPNDNPLIAHVHSSYNLHNIIDYDPPYAKQLREAFLPGPLTLVYPSTNKVSKYVSCGLNTLAVRIPSHAGAQEFLKAVDIPIVAPSANLSKHVSPTSAQHVLDDFDGKIPLILDGGKSEGGIESTVLDVTGNVPVILRPGLITREMIAEVVGDCKEYVPSLTAGEKVKSPGVLYKHYSPRCKTKLYGANDVQAALQYCLKQRTSERVAVLCEASVRSVFEKEQIPVLNLGETAAQMAANLYELLRQAETLCTYLIAIEPSQQGGVMTGVLNRLKKACTSTDIPH